MGVKLRDIVSFKELSLKDLSGKVIAVDAMNALYQFLAIIRQPDGTPLKDRKGRTTSHLSGLFYRTINLIEQGMDLIYIFDGEPPKLKEETIKKRVEIREEAREKWELALQMGEIEEARKYAQMALSMSSEDVDECKALLKAMGVPYLQAPSEGEAQAAYVVMRGDAWASASQDYDSLLFGSPRLVRNLTLRRRRKLPGREAFKEVSMELIVLDDVLKGLNLSREQLVDIAILIGTDYNEGIKGIGPKKALALIKEYGSIEKIRPLKALIEKIPVDDIREIFLNPKVNKDYKIEKGSLKRKKVIEILCDEHDFSIERVEKALDRLEKAREKRAQMSLEAWFK
ncbi:MAG: flap endonuclease-1 [Candidatus Odinarchaeota archaeon]|nr:flap endonuclease-1 [Candidatus Odinarchaeota archaeon]